jgi:dipeptidyl aminopeptidase/acylaminoacyl peptidase
MKSLLLPTSVLSLCSIFAFISVVLATNASAQSLGAQEFFRINEFDGIRISPDGEHIAMAIPSSRNGSMVIMKTESNEIVAQFDVRINQNVGEFHWANNERIVFSTVINVGGLDTPLQTGSIFALNIDNTRKLRLAGPIAADRNVYGISNMLMTDDEHIRVLSARVRRGSINRSRPASHLLDIYRPPTTTVKDSQANLRNEVRSPLPWGRLHSDRSGIVRVATALSEEREVQLHYRQNEDSDWLDISEDFTVIEGDENVLFLDFDLDNKSFYVLKMTDHGTTGLIQYFPETRKTEIIYQHPVFDIGPIDIVLSNRQDKIIGVKFYGNVLEKHYFGDHPDIDLHKSLDLAFPDERVRVTSATRNGEKAILEISGPQRVSDYLILDTSSTQLVEIGSANSLLAKDRMAQVHPFTISSTEGHELRGLVALTNTPSDNQPMIVIPHGGPIGLRDDLNFNREVQFLAHHGFNVLQVNFRGSGGYGREFQRLGYGEWGKGMIRDISLATTWAVQNGLAARDKICIYGGSYGAFAALASVVQEPDKYQCAAGYSGIYDLTTLNDSDIPFNPGGGIYLEDAVGVDETELKQQSPVNFTDNIKIPIFLAHGGQDRRAPISQANNLREKLDESGVVYEWLYKRNEGHGFFDEENRTEFYDSLVSFFNKNLLE